MLPVEVAFNICSHASTVVVVVVVVFLHVPKRGNSLMPVPEINSLPKNG